MVEGKVSEFMRHSKDESTVVAIQLHGTVDRIVQHDEKRPQLSVETHHRLIAALKGLN
jgi:hypothetical protein